MRMIDADALNLKLVSLDNVARSPAQKALLGRTFYIVRQMPTVDGWVSVKDKLPEPHEKNDHEADLMLYIPKREGVRQHGIYLGFLSKEPLPPDDGSGNFWGVKCPGSDWMVWNWSYFEEPIVTHWMPLPEPPKEDADARD